MSKNLQNRNENNYQNQKKSICQLRNEPITSLNETWSNDDSFLSDFNLTNVLENKPPNGIQRSADKVYGNENVDVFSEINKDDLKTCKGSTERKDIGIQSSQKFLEDLTFKIPHNNFPNCSKTCAINLHGSQYETRENIKTRNLFNQTHLMRQELLNLSNLNWETQLFSENDGVEKPDKFPSLGNFYGLPDSVQKLIFEYRGIQHLYDWQNECLNLQAIIARKNLIYALPTSGGKTLVAEILMLREVICRQKNVIFILPYVSIVQEKVSAIAPFALEMDFNVDEYTAGKGRCPPAVSKKRKSIYVASIEKGAVLLDSMIEFGRANEIGLVVVDELHLIGEKGRGATLEALLTKIIFLNANIQIIGMSATIGNLSEMSEFLNADVYTRGFRPIELKEYIKCGSDILEINSSGTSLEEIFVYCRSVHFKYSPEVSRFDPDHIAGLVNEIAPFKSCLIFCSSRKNCENVALLLSRILPKSKFLEYRKNEKLALLDALDKLCGFLSPSLEKTIPYGIAYHHSGLTTDERKLLETAYRLGEISVICCTSTLAAGVNLPAKRVIIRAPYVGQEFLTLCRYKQMIGRAGRAGMGEAGESILISSSRDNIRVGEMLFSPMDKVISYLDNQNAIGLQSLILSAIGLGLTVCLKDLTLLCENTLLAVQNQSSGLHVKTLISSIVRQMFKDKILQVCSDKCVSNSSAFITTQGKQEIHHNNYKSQPILLSKSTRFRLTKFGMAAFKAGIDYKRAHCIYEHFRTAQRNFILSNYTHILYLVVCFNSNECGDELFSADATILFREYTNLDDDTRSLFKILGITEAHTTKMAKTMSVKGVMELQFNRLFKTLILVDVLNIMPIHVISSKFNIERGILQNFISQSSSAASAAIRLCDHVEEFWCFKSLFERIIEKMDRCGSMELESLLDLPAVRINRAKQLYVAGLKSVEDIAKCDPLSLVKSVNHLSLRIAKEIVSAAKVMLVKKLDHLQEETETILSCLQSTVH